MTSMTTTSNLTKEYVCRAVAKIVRGESCEFELVSFKDYRNSTKLRSQRYNSFNVLCYKNTFKSSGWLIYSFVKFQKCPLTSGVMVFNTSLGGTGKFQRHTMSHNSRSRMSLTLERPLPAMSKTQLARSAAFAVALDLRPLCFADKKAGMTMFVNAVFNAGKRTPVSERIDPTTLMPSARSVTEALKGIAVDCRDEYKGILLDKIYDNGGGALTTDGVTLKVQDRQFQDLTIHFIEVTEPTLLKPNVGLQLKVVTLLLKEKPEHGDACTIRGMLDSSLMEHYEKNIDWLTKRCTMVTDCASVMAKVALLSVSPRIAPLDCKWMGCLPHQLNTAMKACVSSLSENPELQLIFDDLQNVKKIVRIFKQSGWNSSLPNGFHLIQECETRFATTFDVMERFIKSAHLVQNIIDEKCSAAAKDAFWKLCVDTNPVSTSTRFSAIEALLDAFRVIVETQTRAQAGNKPSIHLALPLFHRCIQTLDNISDGGSVFRGDQCGLVPPSRLSRKVCRSAKEWLNAKVRVHPLWLSGCFLHPLLREFQFVSSVAKRAEYKSRAETMVRKLVACYNEYTTDGQNDGTQQFNVLSNETTHHGNDSAANAVAGRKQVFSLMEYADSHFQPVQLMDEVGRYNAMDISILDLDRQQFMDDDFSTIRFWHQRKTTYPSLYKAACRVFATPVSSCASERVFSALNRIVSRDHASTSASTLEHIIVARSMIS